MSAPTFFESIAIPLAKGRGWKIAPCFPHDATGEYRGKKIDGKTVHMKLCPQPLEMASSSLDQIHQWAGREPNANVCVYARQEKGGLLFLDKDGARDIRAAYESETGKKFPKTLVVRSSRRNGTERGHIYFLQTPRTMSFENNIAESKTGGWFSLRVKNEYVCTIGSIHPETKEPYTVVEDNSILPMPDDLLDWLQAQMTRKPRASKRAQANGAARAKIPIGQRYNALMSEVGRLWANQWSRDLTIKAGIEWARENYELLPTEGEFDARRVQKRIEHLIDSYPPGLPERNGSLLYFKHNDAGNADRLLAVYGSEILYVPQFKKWLLWDGARWLLDEKNKIREQMRETIKRFYKEAVDKDDADAQKWARTSLNSGAISNAILEARDQRAVLPTELDANRDLLNFKNGTLNLRTLALSQHDPADKITRLIDCNYKRNGTCATFTSFVQQAVGVKQLPLMLRALGYALTGHTSEKVTFFCHGETNTGKTTLLNLFSQHLFNEYSTLIMADSLMAHAKQDAGALSDLADLCGKRFVQTSETREGQRLDEATLKRITPGDALIRAVRKYELPFTFSATHKLFADTNHELEIGGTGDDVWGRVIPIKFGPRVENLDKELPAKLLSEKESIMALLCDEASHWYSEGLGELPQTVNETRNAWKTAADRVCRFVEECCDLGSEYDTLPRPLYKGYYLWDKEGGERPLSETKFFRKLKEMMEKYSIKKPAAERRYAGIDLQPAWKLRLENIEKKEAGIITHAQYRS